MVTAVFSQDKYPRMIIGDLWQWDYGQVLRIQGLSLPDAVAIHFGLQEAGGESVTRIGITADGVTDVVIPDMILENEGVTDPTYPVYVWIYLTDETSGQTKYRVKMTVKTRSKPEEYVGSGDNTMAAILKQVEELVKGGVSGDAVAKAVEDYMAANPLTESDPTVPGWAKAETKPSYSAAEVGADPAGTAETKVSAHNAAEDAHNDIRLALQGLTERLNALADSDDTTLDQMSEVVAYIKSNKSLIDAITTSKVSVSDIIDDLNTNVSNKPLSAAQGVALKALIDAIAVPEKLPNPHALIIKQGEAEVTYDGSGAVTVTIPGSSGGTIRIEKGSTDTAVELEPNKLYIFPEMSELTITLAEITDASVASEYHFIFQSGATATTLSIPDTVNIPSGFSVDASKIYEVSILEGCLCAQSWAVS